MILAFWFLDCFFVLLDLLCGLGFIRIILILPFLLISFLILILFLFPEVEEKSIGITVLELSGDIEKLMDIGLAVEEKSEKGVLNTILFVFQLFLDRADWLFCCRINFALNFKGHIAEVVILR